MKAHIEDLWFEAKWRVEFVDLVAPATPAIPVNAGALDFGPWQRVDFAELDGRRRPRVVVKATGE